MPSQVLAQQACASCRKQKRRCDKVLPACSLCNRMNRPCDYTEHSPIPSSSEFAILHQKVRDLEAKIDKQSPESDIVRQSNGHQRNGSSQHWPAETTYPVALHLDAFLYRDLNMSVPRPHVSIPESIISILNTPAEVHQIVSTYFKGAHNWFPVVSKKRIDLYLQDMNAEPRADLALLFCTMKLFYAKPRDSDPVTPMYWTIKDYCHQLEDRALLSSSLVQSLMIIAIYEIAHGIYPAAYLTTALAARLGSILGLHEGRKAVQIFRRPWIWTEQEERRRMWWGILLLDRYVSIGSPGRPLATPDASRNAVLPCEETFWDQGEMAPSEPIFVNSSTSLRASPFARTCQATHLLGRVINHFNDDSSEDNVDRFTTAIQLHRTVQALASFVPGEFESIPFRLSTAMALMYSTMFLLYEPYACVESNQGERSVEGTELQTICIDGLKRTSELVLRFSRTVKNCYLINGDDGNPLVADCLYQAAANYVWLVGETGSQEYREALHMLEDCLRVLARSWKVASHYLDLLKLNEHRYKDSEHAGMEEINHPNTLTGYFS